MTTLARVWRDHAADRSLRAAVLDASVIAVVGALAILLRIDPPLQPTGTGASATIPWERFATLVPAVLLVLVKHRAPLRALSGGAAVLAVDQALGGSIGVLLVFFDLLYTATLHVSPRALRVLGRLVVAAVVAVGMVTSVLTQDARATFLALLVAVAVLGTPCWWGLSVRQQRELGEAAEGRALAAGRLVALEHERRLQEERTRTARDLHDALAGNLAAISMNAEVGANATAARPASVEHRALTAIRSSGVSALGELRAMIVVLDNGGIDPEQTAPARLEHLDDLLDGVRAAGREVAVVVDGLPVEGPLRGRPQLADLPAAVDQAAHRITTEALTNAIRHGAGPVELALDRGPDDLAVRVVNAVRADADADRTPGGGVGLTSMRERALALGGTVHSAGRDDGTWELVARLRVPREVGA